MQNNTTWIVVANSSQAKLFKVLTFPSKITAIKNLAHPESRLHDQDLVSSKPGRSFQSMGVSRHAYQSVTDPHHAEMEKFARHVAEYLTASFNKGEFKRLYVMANPSFLGLLRQYMDHNTQKSIVAEVPKDMTEHTTEDIERQLGQV